MNAVKKRVRQNVSEGIASLFICYFREPQNVEPSDASIHTSHACNRTKFGMASHKKLRKQVKNTFKFRLKHNEPLDMFPTSIYTHQSCLK